jgi:four helix bundle protein
MSDEQKKAASPKRRQDLKKRTRDYALRIINLYCALPKTTPAQVIGKQLLRSGTSVAAQYREAYRAKSAADFVSKLDGVLGELDESDLWLDLLIASSIVKAPLLEPLICETSDLTAIFVASSKRVKSKPNK